MSAGTVAGIILLLTVGNFALFMILFGLHTWFKSTHWGDSL